MSKRFHSNYMEIPKDVEKHDSKVVTIPDQSLTPQEILVRFAQGRGSSVQRFDSEFDEYDDMSKLDMEEMYALKQDLTSRIEYLETSLSTQQGEIEKQKQLAEVKRKLKRGEQQATIAAVTHD